MAKLYLIQNHTLVPATLVTPARVNPPRPTKQAPAVQTVLEDPEFLLKPQKTNNQPRRRERLTHLTPEEKLNRRKMKNREAAQNARDRKKEQGKQLEDVVRQLAAENKKLKNENTKLKAQVARLTGQRTSYSSASTELELPSSPDSAYASSSTSGLSPVSSSNSTTGYQPVPKPRAVVFDRPVCRVCRTPDVPAAEQDDRPLRFSAPPSQEEMVPEPFEGTVGEYVEVYAEDVHHPAQFDEFDRLPVQSDPFEDFQPCASYPTEPAAPQIHQKETFGDLPAFDDLVQSSFLDELCSELEIYPTPEENQSPYLNDIDMNDQTLFDWCDNM